MIEKRESPVGELITIRDYLRWATSRFNAAHLFFGHGTDNAWDEAVQLIMPSLHLPWDSSPDLLNARLTSDERKLLVELIERRISERIPAAYLTGKAWFAGLEFYVDERVLVPRSPLAEMIGEQFQPWLTVWPERVLDLCTGSGCIGIACARQFADAEVILSDIDAGALQVAQANIDKHRLGDQVSAVQSDLFSGLVGQSFDLIVSNPPYVNAEDLDTMPAEFRAEPAIALGSGNDGLAFTRRLLREARAHLRDGGLLVVEVGNSWPALEAAYPSVPFTWVELADGGHGVFTLSAEQLDQYAEALQAS
ncbi:50S ribosomal protein L3 N(5)-glutamine methyltransferase [Pseudomaricurvus alcaniphilus]|uniref:50S ribosomal protein L3 N(5)-glutamine methyltransferase n=1 Tax=Pseudomaricurvus alcaniphilus TaxID=1166482 RepID=UPI001A9E35D1|nr:50S ribosomal protein L3 N(5)-glutamine methyltransferase [Pseudomaricurvus alcaniphilus]